MDAYGYEGNIIADLFGEEAYFDNADAFWAAQNVAIAGAKDRYLADGWAEVIILDVGDYFPSYAYVDTAKEGGGKIYVRIAQNGEVTFYEGQLSRKAVKAKEKAADGEGCNTSQKPELTKAMQNYLDLHRHAAVRTELLSHQGIAIRIAVAQIIAGSDLWTIHADAQKASSNAIADSLASNNAEGVFDEEQPGRAEGCLH